MYLLGDPRAVSVRGELRPSDLVIENNRLAQDPSAVFEVAFEGGATGYAISGGGWDIEVFGSEGSIRAVNNGIDWSWRKPCKDGRQMAGLPRGGIPEGRLPQFHAQLPRGPRRGT